MLVNITMKYYYYPLNCGHVPWQRCDAFRSKVHNISVKSVTLSVLLHACVLYVSDLGPKYSCTRVLEYIFVKLILVDIMVKYSYFFNTIL